MERLLPPFCHLFPYVFLLCSGLVPPGCSAQLLSYQNFAASRKRWWESAKTSSWCCLLEGLWPTAFTRVAPSPSKSSRSLSAGAGVHRALQNKERCFFRFRAFIQEGENSSLWVSWSVPCATRLMITFRYEKWQWDWRFRPLGFTPILWLLDCSLGWAKICILDLP